MLKTGGGGGERVKTAVSPERNNKRASRVKAIIPWVLFDFQGSSVRSVPRTTNRAAGPFAYVYVCKCVTSFAMIYVLHVDPWN